jgi:hypothetical protein
MMDSRLLSISAFRVCSCKSEKVSDDFQGKPFAFSGFLLKCFSKPKAFPGSFEYQVGSGDSWSVNNEAL